MNMATNRITLLLIKPLKASLTLNTPVITRPIQTIMAVRPSGIFSVTNMTMANARKINVMTAGLIKYGSIRARTLVDNEQLDVAMANMDFYNLDKYNSYVMMEDRYVYCVSKTHRYAGEKEITMEMLKDEPIILFNTDSVQTQTVITRLRSAGITPNVHMYCSQLTTVLNYVRGSKCGAFLYSSIAANPRDFVAIPVTPEITSKFGIIWKKGIFVPDQLTKFVNFIKTYDVTPYLPKL